ncbi:MAG: SufD family Fe-S cluster assembly protein [Bacilli bacterium]|nr:SufD family Fe-S cluster assembly protein [Bacilli bacterium]
MNKIKVVGDILELANVSKNIHIEYYRKECIFGINEVKIVVTKDSLLDIEIKLKEDTKLNFSISVLENVNLDLNIITKGDTGKVQYKYNLEKNSNINIFKFQNIKSIKEMVIARLNGENARIDYNFKTISNKKETYDYHVFHYAKNTVSNIKNNGVCVKDGLIIYQVSSFVPEDITGCVVNQSNRIINLTNNKSEIMPNLYIDCNDVEASHSALIGKFSDEEMFYLQSRGIDYNTALKLLINGFLTSDINNKKILKEINKNIEKYWR